MPTMDIFTGDAFSMQEITDALDKVPHKPQRLGEIGIFTPKPIRTETFSIEKRDGVLSLIATSQRGDALEQRAREHRDIRDFRTTRLAKGDVIRASELQNIRAFGKESELVQVQTEILRRNVALRSDLELTMEYHRLGAVQGIVLDADGSTVIYDWFSEWGLSAPAEIDFDLDAASPTSGVLRKLINAQVIRPMQRAAKGAWTTGTRIHALCGDAFFDDLVAHKEVRETYLGYQAAADLRNEAGRVFNFGGVTWENYQGTDDNSTVAIGTDKVRFFPVGARGVFEVAYSPAEFFPYVNQPGQPFYGMVLPDMKRQAYVELEVYSYPMHYCTRPEMLLRGKRT